jgi:hypothetical protein
VIAHANSKPKEVASLLRGLMADCPEGTIGTVYYTIPYNQARTRYIYDSCYFVVKVDDGFLSSRRYKLSATKPLIWPMVRREIEKHWAATPFVVTNKQRGY